MLSWGPDQIVIAYVPRACSKKNLESISPKILVFGHIFLGPFRALLTQGRTMLSWGSDQTVIVYVPRACIKKNLEWISLIILILDFMAHAVPFSFRGFDIKFEPSI